jgi:ribose transport system permease protein
MNEGPEQIAVPRASNWREALERFGPLLALALLVLTTSFFSHAFLKPENILNLLRENSFIGIVSLAMTFVIISGGIDLSVGALAAFVAVAGMWVMNTAIGASSIIASADLARQIHVQPTDDSFRIALARVLIWINLSGSEFTGVLLGAAVTLLVGTAAGWLNGLAIAKGRLAPFIATLAAMAIFRSLAQTLADGGEVLSSSERYFDRLGQGGIGLFGAQIGAGVPLVLPYPVLVFAIMAAASWIVLDRTRYGRYVYALGCNERSAIYSAVNVDRVKLITYTLSGAFCGVAGLLLASRLNSINSGNAGLLYELDAIAAVVIGGTRMQGGSGGIGGTIIGVLILGIISNMLTLMNVSPYLQGLIKGMIILAACLLQRGGKYRQR